MTYDLERLLGKARHAAKSRRLPEPQPLHLLSLSIASILCGERDGAVRPKAKAWVSDVALRLRHVQTLYHDQLDRIAVVDRGPGRPPNDADVALVFGMLILWVQDLKRGFPPLRDYRDGKEQPTHFQELCNLWIGEIDPDRPPLAAAAFREAAVRYDRIVVQRKQKPSTNKNH